MFLFLVIATALGAPDGYKQTREGYDGCDLFLGPKEADGVVPMRAECRWPEVSLEKFDAAFSQWDLHDDIFSTISASDVLGKAGDTTEVRQIQVTKGISDRFIVIKGTRAAIDGGGYRYAWTRSDHTMAPPSGTVQVTRSDGHWEVRPLDGGGVALVHQLSYDPGGSVPSFMVRWFQTSGLQGIVTDLRQYMAKR